MDSGVSKMFTDVSTTVSGLASSSKIISGNSPISKKISYPGTVLISWDRNGIYGSLGNSGGVITSLTIFAAKKGYSSPWESGVSETWIEIYDDTTGKYTNLYNSAPTSYQYFPANTPGITWQLPPDTLSKTYSNLSFTFTNTQQWLHFSLRTAAPTVRGIGVSYTYYPG